jgi:hypothetical protein
MQGASGEIICQFTALFCEMTVDLATHIVSAGADNWVVGRVS